VRRQYKDIVDRLIEMRAHLASLESSNRQREIRDAMQPPRFLQNMIDTKVGILLMIREGSKWRIRRWTRTIASNYRVASPAIRRHK
jgi:hypothetical protein